METLRNTSVRKYLFQADSIAGHTLDHLGKVWIGACVIAEHAVEERLRLRRHLNQVIETATSDVFAQ